MRALVRDAAADAGGDRGGRGGGRARRADRLERSPARRRSAASSPHARLQQHSPRGCRQPRSSVSRCRWPTAARARWTLEAAFGGEERRASVSDPLGRGVEARWLLLPDGRGVVESAQAIGLSLLSPSERNPVVASSRGLGELVRAAAEEARELLVGLATRRRSTAAEVCARCSTSCPPRPRSSVTCGTRCSTPPASSPRRRVPRRRRSKCSRRALLGMREPSGMRRLPAPGQLGVSGPPSPLSARRLCPGPTVIDAAGLREQMLGADLVVTGEGVVDRTSMEGKLSGTVAALCSDLGVRCAVFGGRRRGAARCGDPRAQRRACARARDDLVAAGELLGRSL